jgi:hypothetical protein
MDARTLVLFLIPALVGCMSVNVAGVEAAATTSTAVASGAVAMSDTAPPAVELYGTFRHGFWFDRELYSVWVRANSPAEAERIAIETASKSCADRKGVLRVEWFDAWEERRLFVPVKSGRFSYEARFRCAPALPR